MLFSPLMDYNGHAYGSFLQAVSAHCLTLQAILAGLDPMALIFPLTLAAKFAFMMPIATPPNAIVYSLGALRVKDMVNGRMIIRYSNLDLLLMCIT